MKKLNLLSTHCNKLNTTIFIESSLISRSLHFNKTNPYNKTKWSLKKIMKKIDLRSCRCCDNNPLRKSSKSSENSCRFFARAIVLAHIFALQFTNFPGSWQGGIVACASMIFVLCTVDQSKCATLHSAIPLLSAEIPKSHQLNLIQVGHK